MNCAPVLMIGFNRPEFTRELLACVRRARPKRLYFAVDGARLDRPGEDVTVRNVQAIVKEVDWHCDVNTLFRDKNLGCARGVSEAITWFFSHESYGIILEDDIRPTDDFFRYETELLERYKDDERVGMVSGFNHHGFQTVSRDSYHFTTHSDIWGWGSWARVWKRYNLDIKDLLPNIDNVAFRFTSNKRMASRLRAYANDVIQTLSTWDVQYSIMFSECGYLAAAPRKRLVANVGVGDLRGTHTSGYSFDAIHYRDVGAVDATIVHPVVVAPDFKAIAKTEARMCGILPRGLTYVGSRVHFLRPVISIVGNVLEKIMPALFRL